MTNALLFFTGWLLLACALGLTIARAIPPSADDPVIDFTHGEVYTK